MSDNNREDNTIISVELDDNSNGNVDKDKSNGADNDTRSKNHLKYKINIKINLCIINICPSPTIPSFAKNMCLHHFFHKNSVSAPALAFLLLSKIWAWPSLSSSVEIFTPAPAPAFLLLSKFLVSTCLSRFPFFSENFMFAPTPAYPHPSFFILPSKLLRWRLP